jgi:putative isomerase
MNESYHHAVDFNLEKFKRDMGVDPSPKGPISVDFSVPVASEQTVVRSLRTLVPSILRPPRKEMRHPYLVPGAIYDQLWDWDAYFMGMGVLDSHTEFYRGSILNFLEKIRPDGQPAKLIRADGTVNYEDLAYPIQAQWCAAVCHQTGDVDWLTGWWPRLAACRAWYEAHCMRRRGLFRQPISRGAGLDNDPVIYGRRPETVALVDMNCFHFREYQALAWLGGKLGKRRESAEYHAKAERLKQAINEYMWDPIDGMFYHLDLSDHDHVTRQKITWELPYKVRSAASLFVLWGGVADQEKAQRVIEEHVLNPAEYLSDFGIRSLAKNERMYNNAMMGDPSNWQGPIWGLITPLVAYGLAHYGYREAALEVGERLVAVFAADLHANGTLHEYYHAETGNPVFNPGFLSWNLLALRIMEDLRKEANPFRLVDK